MTKEEWSINFFACSSFKKNEKLTNERKNKEEMFDKIGGEILNRFSKYKKWEKDKNKKIQIIKKYNKKIINDILKEHYNEIYSKMDQFYFICENEENNPDSNTNYRYLRITDEIRLIIYYDIENKIYNLIIIDLNHHIINGGKEIKEKTYKWEKNKKEMINYFKNNETSNPDIKFIS